MLKKMNTPEQRTQRRDRMARKALRFARFHRLCCEDCGSDAASIYQWGKYTCPCPLHRTPDLDSILCNPCLRRSIPEAYRIIKPAGVARAELRELVSHCHLEDLDD